MDIQSPNQSPGKLFEARSARRDIPPAKSLRTRYSHRGMAIAAILINLNCHDHFPTPRDH
jgi:hypothetical protein